MTGAPSALALAIRTVRRGGVLVQIGNLPGDEIPVPANAIMAKEIDFRGSFGFHKEFEQAVDLIVQSKFDVQQLITARRPLAEAPAAMRLALDRSQASRLCWRRVRAGGLGLFSDARFARRHFQGALCCGIPSPANSWISRLAIVSLVSEAETALPKR